MVYTSIIHDDRYMSMVYPYARTGTFHQLSRCDYNLHKFARIRTARWSSASVTGDAPSSFSPAS